MSMLLRFHMFPQVPAQHKTTTVLAALFATGPRTTYLAFLGHSYEARYSQHIAAFVIAFAPASYLRFCAA